MKTVRETVALPDATVQPLVHPLDVAEARKPFVVSWALSVATAPTVVFVLGALLWTVSNNYVTPIVVPLVIATCSGLLGGFLRRDAWGHIPRKRQDVLRPLPTSWSVLQAVISTASLLAGLVLLTLWVVGRDVGPDVLGYILGTAIGIVLLMVAELLWTVFAPGRRSAELGSWASQLARLVAVTAAVVVGWLVTGARHDLTELTVPVILLGAGVIIAVRLLWWLTAFWRTR